jgi:hypothetical protein
MHSLNSAASPRFRLSGQRQAAIAFVQAGQQIGVVAFGEAEARETVNPRFGQIARASSSKATATRRVTASSTPSS